MEMDAAAKHIRRSDRTRRLTRFAFGLALLPLGFLTATLFLATSGVTPEAFTSWRDLGCRVLLTQPGQTFCGITNCGRAYLTVDGQPDSTGRYHVEFYDLLTSERIGTVSATNLEFSFSKSKKNLLAIDFSDASLTELNTGNRLATFDVGNPVQFWPNSGTNSVLLRSDNDAEVWDMETGQRLRSVSRPRVRMSFGFCDSACEPKCITVVQHSGQVELWDESKGLRDLVLKESNLKVTVPAGSAFTSVQPFTLSPDCRLIAIPFGKVITIRSLIEGSTVRTLQADQDSQITTSYSGSAMIGTGSKLRFSFNNLWLTREYDTPNPIVAKAQDMNSALAQWLTRWLPNEKLADLVNLETGETWKRIPAGHGVAFSDDDSRLVTFGDKGRFIWSVPPRVQSFTPWAFVALGAWLSFAMCWWKMRNRTKVGTSPQGLNP